VGRGVTEMPVGGRGISGPVVLGTHNVGRTPRNRHLPVGKGRRVVSLLPTSSAAIKDRSPCKNEPAQNGHSRQDRGYRMAQQQGGPYGTSEGRQIRHDVVDGSDESLIHDMGNSYEDTAREGHGQTGEPPISATDPVVGTVVQVLNDSLDVRTYLPHCWAYLVEDEEGGSP